MCVLTLKISHRPHGRLMFCSFLQGGGVYVYSGTVTMTSCSITGNTASAGSVRAHVETSHRPDGKIADALALILACATATDASINYSRYVPQRPANSHRPDGIFTCFALACACRAAVSLLGVAL